MRPRRRAAGTGRAGASRPERALVLAGSQPCQPRVTALPAGISALPARVAARSPAGRAGGRARPERGCGDGPARSGSTCRHSPASTCLQLHLSPPASTCHHLIPPTSTCLHLPSPAFFCLHLSSPAFCLHLRDSSSKPSCTAARTPSSALTCLHQPPHLPDPSEPSPCHSAHTRV